VGGSISRLPPPTGFCGQGTSDCGLTGGFEPPRHPFERRFTCEVSAIFTTDRIRLLERIGSHAPMENSRARIESRRERLQPLQVSGHEFIRAEKAHKQRALAPGLRWLFS
jgi:hypothetical protein